MHVYADLWPRLAHDGMDSAPAPAYTGPRVPIARDCRMSDILIVATLLQGAAFPAFEWYWGPVLPSPTSCRATAVVNDMVVTVGDTRWAQNAVGTRVMQWSRAVFALDASSLPKQCTKPKSAR